MNLYDQESKSKVREIMLEKAVSGLTTESSNLGLLDQDELRITLDYFLYLIKKAYNSDRYSEAAQEEFKKWEEFSSSGRSAKKPGDLKVLYLCGPAPENDLRVMEKYGINTHNVWAITSHEDSAAAHVKLEQLNLALKIHEGSLAEFFEVYNEVFDLIYFDACGPFMGGKPSTVYPLFQVFEKQRLAPRGSLITNYSSPPEDGKARCRFEHLATAYFHPRYTDLPDIVSESRLDPAAFQCQTEELFEFTKKKGHLEPIYSDLVTKLTIDLAAVIIPNLRTYSMNAFVNIHANSMKEVKRIINRQTDNKCGENGLPGHLWLCPDAYPILSFIKYLQKHQPSDPLLGAFSKYNQNGIKFDYRIALSELSNRAIEGNWDVLSRQFKEAVSCEWFDYRKRIACDIPLPNLQVSAITGSYGRPYFYNGRQSHRVKYTSNVREMFCDLFAFDQCRSFFDWYPTVQACPSRFQSIPFQIVARCLIDRLGWANYQNTANPFRGSAIAGKFKTSVAKPIDIPNRIEI